MAISEAGRRTWLVRLREHAQFPWCGIFPRRSGPAREVAKEHAWKMRLDIDMRKENVFGWVVEVKPVTSYLAPYCLSSSPTFLDTTTLLLPNCYPILTSIIP